MKPAATTARRVGSKLVGIVAVAVALLAVTVTVTLTLTLTLTAVVHASVDGEERGGGSSRRNLRRTLFHWSRDCPSPSSFGFGLGSEHGADSNSDGENNENAIGNADCCCSITDYGAVGDNSTLNTIAIQSTINNCHEICFLESAIPSRIIRDDAFGLIPTEPSLQAQRGVVVYVPRGMFRTGALSLRSNTRFHIGRGASIYGSDKPEDYPIVPMVPNGYQTHRTSMFRALFSGYNVDNVSITGENDGYPQGSFARFSSSPAANGATTTGGSTNDTSVSVIDGVGWKWWCKARSMPVPQSYCQEMNPNNETIPDSRMRPKLIEFYNSTNIILDRFMARNSPVWFIHPFLSKNISMTNLTLLAPRSIGNTDGLDPDSCENVLMDSCYIDVGDDGVSIKSTNHSGTMAPTRNITMRNLRIVSRNWCIGSATFGGVYDILFEDSTIGDPDMITSPWAIKFKSHRYYPGPMENITIRRIEMGKIGPTPWMYPKAPGSAFLIGLSYGENTKPPHNKRSGKPLFRNVTLEDISVVSAGVAGQIRGFPEDCLEGLSLRNITVLGGAARWNCDNIDLDSLAVSNVRPPVSCRGGCARSNATTHALFRGSFEGKIW